MILLLAIKLKTNNLQVIFYMNGSHNMKQNTVIYPWVMKQK